MPLLPKPYPDEVIGSVIARGAWQSGMPAKTLIREVYGATHSSGSFLMGSGFATLARLSGVDAEELLMLHTMFPYATAFMPTPMQAALKAKVLQPVAGVQCVSSITKNASHGVPFRRVCLHCVREEMAMYGECYWHRQHLLPGSLICLKHGTALANTRIALRGQTNGRVVSRPQLDDLVPLRADLPPTVLTSIAKLSTDALNGALGVELHCAESYRTRALKLGFVLASGDVASVALSNSVQGWLGKSFLQDSGCQMSECRPWPSLMVRPKNSVPFATPKHVIFNAFLDRGENFSASECSCYEKPGPKPRDFSAIDAQLASRMEIAIEKVRTEGARITVRELLTETFSRGIFKHHRHELPITSELIEQFRASDLSKRQVGGSAYWRKRLPKRYCQ